MQEMSWKDVNGWVMYGGSFLGTQKQLPERNMSQVAATLEKFKIHGLLIIGGFEVLLNLISKRRLLIAYCIW